MQPVSRTLSPYQILVVDDCPLIRLGLRFILMPAHDLRVSGEVGAASDAAEMVCAGEYDIAVLDDSLPDYGIVESIQIMRSACPNIKIIVMGNYSVDRGVVAMKSGAMGYIGKDLSPEKILDVIRSVAAGKKYIDGDIAERMFTELIYKNCNQRHLTLSHRESQVFRFIASGETLSGMARFMKISSKTVSIYRARVMEKMGFRKNVEVICYAARLNLNAGVAA